MITIVFERKCKTTPTRTFIIYDGVGVNIRFLLFRCFSEKKDRKKIKIFSIVFPKATEICFAVHTCTIVILITTDK